ncbi:unnamed protein product [Leptosia nina]|uniref:Uncharacterized protein n=1 Tax=Leptosia nina TaxID=320188 RepID=A0AAV1K398_9NEOP
MKRSKEKPSSTSKGRKGKKKETQPPKRPSILDVMKQKSNCNCEVVARAVRSNVHMNLGLAEKRPNLGKDRNPE